jgi:hypothetical protein
LGIIETAFKVDKQLQTAIDSIYKYKSIDIGPFAENIQNKAALDSAGEISKLQILDIIKIGFEDKLNELADCVKERIE